MNSAERVKLLLKRQNPDQMGLFEHFWPETLTQSWPAQGYPTDADPARHFDYDIQFAANLLNSEFFPGRNEIVEETDEWKVVRDGRDGALPDGFFLYEDYGFRNGLFCSPQHMRELIMPYEKALVDFFKSWKLPVILHSCGDIRQAIPLVIEAGLDCLQPMEAKAGSDVLDGGAE